MNKDLYKILEVDKNASDAEIRKAYLKLSKKYHPDMQSGKTDAEKKEAEEKFKEINEAHEILSNKEKRQYYDNFGSTDGRPNFGGGGIDPREFFRHMHHGFDDFDDFEFNMGGFQNRHRNNPNDPKNGKDFGFSLNITFEEALFGTNKDFTVSINDPCPDCKGTGSEGGETTECPMCHGTGMYGFRKGMMIMQQTCPTCHGSGHIVQNACKKCNGSGRVSNERKININIPMGINSGTRLRIAGEGEKGLNGGLNGNIYIMINVSDNEIFERDGMDISTIVHITPTNAILGGDIDVQTPWGIATLKIPAGVDFGKVFRIKEQGVHTKDSKGDLYVRIFIDSLKDITPEQKKLIEKLEKTIKEQNIPFINRQKQVSKMFEDKVKTLRPKS